MEIKGFRLGPLLRSVGREILEDGVLGLAAQTAYFFFFSLFPLILFAAPLLSFVGDKQELIERAMAQLAAHCLRKPRSSYAMSSRTWCSPPAHPR